MTSHKCMFAVLMCLLLLAGCREEEAPKVPVPVVSLKISPCMDRPSAASEMQKGFQYLETVDSNTRMSSHCIPCTKAKTGGEKFVCEGESAFN